MGVRPMCPPRRRTYIPRCTCANQTALFLTPVEISSRCRIFLAVMCGTWHRFRTRLLGRDISLDMQTSSDPKA